MKQFVINSICSVVLSSSAACGVAGAAEAARDFNRVTVNYGDLSLSSKEGIDLLYARLANAAERVCDSLDGKDIERHAKFLHCKRDALENAINNVAVPALLSHRDPHFASK